MPSPGAILGHSCMYDYAFNPKLHALAKDPFNVRGSPPPPQIGNGAHREVPSCGAGGKGFEALYEVKPLGNFTPPTAPLALMIHFAL